MNQSPVIAPCFNHKQRILHWVYIFPWYKGDEKNAKQVNYSRLILLRVFSNIYSHNLVYLM